MIPSLQALRDRVLASIKSPERQAIAETLMADLMQLQVRTLAGEPVEAEVRQVQAQAALLTATEAQVIRDEFLGWVGDVAKVVVGAAFAAAG